MAAANKRPSASKTGQRKPPTGELDMILIGRTGNGKSATGNSILNKPVFKSNYSMGSVTKLPKDDSCEFLDTRIMVVDCPGLFDTAFNETEGTLLFTHAIHTVLLANHKGFHAFLFVVRFENRFTQEEAKSIVMFKQILGEDFFKKYGIIVMTNGDTFRRKNLKLENFCNEQKENGFKDLVFECNNRIIIFDNETKDFKIKLEQRTKLVTMVKALSKENQRYTNAHIKKFEAQLENDVKVKLKEIIKSLCCILDRIFQNKTNKEDKLDMNEIARHIAELESNIKPIATPNESDLVKLMEQLRSFVIAGTKKKSGQCETLEQDQLLELRTDFYKIKEVVDTLHYRFFEELVKESIN